MAGSISAVPVSLADVSPYDLSAILSPSTVTPPVAPRHHLNSPDGPAAELEPTALKGIEELVRLFLLSSEQ